MHLGRLAVFGTVLGIVALGSACGPATSCFVAGTKVRTPRGDVAIEDLEVGDEVVSFRTDDGARVVRKVEHLLRAIVNDVVHLEIGDVLITTTDEHPFWDAERRAWVPARELTVGTVLVHLDENGITSPKSVTAIHFERRPETRVFNLTVEGPEHDYFAEGIAVHNKSTCIDNCLLPPPDAEDAGPSSFAVSVQDLTPSLRIARSEYERNDAIWLNESITSRVPARDVVLEVGGVFVPGGNVTVLDGTKETSARASIVTFVGQPTRWLVIGSGSTELKRGQDGTPKLTPIGSTYVIRLVDGPTPPACKGAPVTPALRWKAPPSSDTRRTIAAQQWNDATGCVTVDFEDGQTLFACMPKESWPFQVGEAVLIPVTGREARRLEIRGPELPNGNFDMLALERGEQMPDTSVVAVKVDLLLLVLEPRPACTSYEEKCGATRVPADVFTYENGVKKPVVPGLPIATPGQTIERRWVLSAFTEPIARTDCATTEEPPVPPGASVDLVMLIKQPR